MAFSPQLGRLVALLTLLSWVSPALGATIAYCASLLTTTSNANSSIYQSDGLCSDFCRSSYAYAIVQDSNCWCSDYTPAAAVQVDTSKCDTDCPGYPSDKCGGSGVYGYLSLGKAAAGTLGADTSTTAAAGTTTQAVTDATTPATTVSPSTYVSTVTQGNDVILKTVTVMPTVTGSTDSSASSNDVGTGQKGISTGAAVGTAVGVLGGVVIFGAVGVWVWLRRKRQNQGETMLEHQNSFRGSSAGMMSTPRTDFASVWDGEGNSMGRRSSRLMPHDPRMDPYAANIYNRFDNKSHESINTLRDDQDYSRRVLRTTNPDPTGD
ncbi:hypothetical protein JX265_003485 [Neoarthrinium moseri]|uniref:WSC domain-containing protein n=1 Tax=Neoarthrinium moseri TaxID=1658444 RepID=A0A9Q0ARU6_9PEZI|nr:uncharacterized protein JN550_002231 [Neoarthrinium moseri]KAI1850113.1 hypothetical protein JX266_004492 [Neoarthrinium moseri]KAI1874802.1 hypothetical protein JN550_002231 [Neoarthrinium moseri]KAI1877477.1 hypothetical protein JX265_003485 [Neoarthrinium moseri]